MVPTGIAEEDSASEKSVNKKQGRSIQGSVNGSVAQSKKYQNCTGCPGCTEPYYAPPLPDNNRTMPGENRVRAWLEDVKTLDRRWKDFETQKYPTNSKSLSQSLEYLKEMRKFDVSDTDKVPMRKSPQWRDNPSMLQSFRNIARSEILGTDDRHSIPVRPRSVIVDSNFRRQELSKHSFSMEDIAANVKIRKAIENSFMIQMEETAMLEGKKEEHLNNAINSNVSPQNQDQKPPLELPDMINELPKNPRKIMDAVIREMVVSKIEKTDLDQPSGLDYEVDSLERTKNPRKISCSSTYSNNETGSSTALPMDEELTMQNAVINAKTGEMTTSKLRRSSSDQSLNFSDLVTQKQENYSLVSEVYVNDGYDSPASDDSGPEIQYEPENPGHLMIKVHDSPENYIRKDDSEYEPDTLDRKPMKLKINAESKYQRSIKKETYVDSLERPGQILLKSSGSFKNSVNTKPKIKRGLKSLREIYEARMKGQSIENLLVHNEHVVKIRNNLGDDSDSDKSWQKTKYLTPDSRQARRQRKPMSRPDVVPPPPMEGFYQRPKPPDRIEEVQRFVIKNDKDRSCEKAGYPTTTSSTPVQAVPSTCVGSRTWTKECAKHKREVKEISQGHLVKYDSNCCLGKKDIKPGSTTKTIRNTHKVPSRNLNSYRFSQNQVKVDDSGYLSSADSSESQRQLLKSDTTEGSLSETDETESICDGASESGAESIGTDSVFFGNFRKLSETSKFSKSTDSGVELDTQNTFLKQPHLKLDLFPGTNLFNASDSEAESFVTVLAPNSRRRNSLVL